MVLSSGILDGRACRSASEKRDGCEMNGPLCMCPHALKAEGQTGGGGGADGGSSDSHADPLWAQLVNMPSVGFYLRGSPGLPVDAAEVQTWDHLNGKLENRGLISK